MGFGGIGVWQLLIVLAIVVMLFGTRKLRGSGEDLGAAVRNFKQAFKSDAGDDTQDKLGPLEAHGEKHA